MRFLRFLSLTTATQLCLLINQLVLLPWQLRIWGSQVTAGWFVVIAVANLATVADLGLRTAGHAQLFASVQTRELHATREFSELWTLTRALFVAVTLVLLIVQMVSARASGTPLYAWMMAVTIAAALDTVTIVRGMWLDTLGHFNKVEAVFLIMSASRVVLSFLVLVAFHAPPAVVGWITLATAIGGMISQAAILNEPAGLRLLARGTGRLHLKALFIVRFVVAEPAANWVRLSLPVIVLTAIAPAIFVTTYVAMRALFGLARQLINQISRYASVGYVHRATTDQIDAERYASRSILASTIVSVGVASATIADHGRLLGIWLHEVDIHAMNVAGLSFALSATAYGYQVITGVMMRSGDVPGVAKRQYVYLIVAACAAALGRLTASPVLYLVLAATNELLLAGLFATVLGLRVKRTAIGAFIAATTIIGVLWLAADGNLGSMFDDPAPIAIVASLGVAGLASAVMVAACVALDRLPAGHLGDRRAGGTAPAG